jgi:hypothetical protein
MVIWKNRRCRRGRGGSTAMDSSDRKKLSRNLVLSDNMKSLKTNPLRKTRMKMVCCWDELLISICVFYSGTSDL